MKRVHLIISGDVVGVGYRAWILRYAADKRLTGWVTNRQDDTVEILVEGPKRDLEELIKRCGEGPLLAVVKHVDVRWEEATGAFVSFEVVY
ncbi:acylphosphatase [Candidatus Gottesmanbacteria bacterium]|nr:acylphosphatase [Candidatus Gottesmanbacteria bacterium]